MSTTKLTTYNPQPGDKIVSVNSHSVGTEYIIERELPPEPDWAIWEKKGTQSTAYYIKTPHGWACVWLNGDVSPRSIMLNDDFDPHDKNGMEKIK